MRKRRREKGRGGVRARAKLEEDSEIRRRRNICNYWFWCNNLICCQEYYRIVYKLVIFIYLHEPHTKRMFFVSLDRHYFSACSSLSLPPTLSVIVLFTLTWFVSFPGPSSLLPRALLTRYLPLSSFLPLFCRLFKCISLSFLYFLSIFYFSNLFHWQQLITPAPHVHSKELSKCNGLPNARVKYV